MTNSDCKSKSNVLVTAIWFIILFVGILLVLLIVVILQDLSSAATTSTLFWRVLLIAAMFGIGLLGHFEWWHGPVFMLVWEGTKYALTASDALVPYFADPASKVAADIFIGSGAYIVGWAIPQLQPKP